MLSKEGFYHMANALVANQIKRGHVDVVFKAWLLEEDTAQRIGACYIYPSLGCYYCHVSGCGPKGHGEAQGGRPSAWEHHNPASGTRSATDPKYRGKFLIQWRGNKSAVRVWINCPSDIELV